MAIIKCRIVSSNGDYLCFVLIGNLHNAGGFFFLVFFPFCKIEPLIKGTQFGWWGRVEN
jgi:hypothetical protein